MTTQPAIDVAILGYGRFGRALGQLFAEAGVSLRAHDPQADVPAEVRADSPAELVRGARFVVVSVPVPRIRAALHDLAPHLAKDGSQIVLDVGSVKVGPSAALGEVLGASVPWVATHPLFGPLSLALAERPLRVVLCPAPATFGPSHATAAASVRALYERIDCEVIEQTAESHDRVMAHTHALTFFVAKGMIDAGAGMEVPFAPPSFQAIARAIETVRSDAGHLFSAIARDNPFAAEARKQLVQALSSIDRALDAQSASPAGESGDAAPDSAGRFVIPDLGDRSPELKEAREHIDRVDRDIVRLLAQRAQLSLRAARAKARLGAPVLDSSRETEVMGARRAWAEELKLDEDAVADVFRAIMTMSRRAQRT
ncbi:MAG TPA: prephenate dehydrogenase/arogenate dehydrogenase family protein [Polyangiaceae bacterium]|jgi:prephenate dehydrogenase